MDDDRTDEPTGPPDDPPAPGSAESVRIIGAEEAAAAIESGQVAARRPEDAPRFGDVPQSPAGPRPPLRFPLPGTDPETVPRPPVVGPEARSAPASPPPASGPPASRRPGLTGSGEVPLPHWTEPPSGEVPRILPDAEPPQREADDDLSAWSTLSAGPRWREQAADWEGPDFGAAVLDDQETRVGALGAQPSDEGADDFFRDEAPPAPRTTRPRRAVLGEDPPTAAAPTPPAPGGGDLSSRVVTGVIFGAVVLGAAWLGPAALLLVAGVVIVMATGELYKALRVRGYQPATLLGLVGTASLLAASYWRGESAQPLVLMLFVVFCLLWYLTGVIRARPAVNVAVSVMAFLYVGFLGSFVALMLKFPDRNGVAFFLGAVLATAAYDIGAFAVGRRMGRTPLAPDISPGKTWEGMLGASLATLVICLTIVRAIHPWNLGHAFWLAVVVVVAAPLGDLCESMVKRDLNLKDMGTVLPGHGGVLDRVDALLFVIPATYYLVRLLEIG